MKNIFLTGSLANGEGTLIDCGSSMIASDFDFVVGLDFPYFVRKRKLLQTLSRDMSNILLRKRFFSHVDFLPRNNIFLKISNYPSIYLYEFAFASKCILGKNTTFGKSACPSKMDALELTFTVVSDLAFKNDFYFSKAGIAYLYAKRALTLLNSLLIFQGVIAKTYERRMKLAIKGVWEGKIPLNAHDIKVLESYTEFKLSGSITALLKNLKLRKIEELIEFQRRFLWNLTTKILYYELLDLASGDLNARDSENLSSNLPELLRNYSLCSKSGRLSRLLGITLCGLWLLTKDNERKELFTTFIFHKQPPKTILNILLTLHLWGGYQPITQLLTETLPWVSNGNTSLLNKLNKMWRTAEQSIKLS